MKKKQRVKKERNEEELNERIKEKEEKVRVNSMTQNYVILIQNSLNLGCVETAN